MQRIIFVGILMISISFAMFAQSDVSSPQWHGWEAGIKEAHASGKFLLIDIFTNWCGWCKKLDNTVYIHPRVQELLAARFVPIKLNAESETIVANGANHYTERECAKLLDVNSYPTILVFDSHFRLVARLNGYRDTDTFVRFLHYVIDNYYSRYTFEQYLRQIPPEY